jgi:hypothetical protein
VGFLEKIETSIVPVSSNILDDLKGGIKLKKKYWTIIPMSLFLLSAGAFHYDGTKNHASANKDLIVDSSVINTEEVNEPVQQITESIPKVTPKNGSKVSENIPEKNQGKINNTGKDNDYHQNEQKDNASSITNKKESDNTIIIDGSEYVLMMDEKKYPNLVEYIKVARNNKAKLYGIPNSDVMTMMKDGKRILDMSSGVKNVLPEYADIVKGLFSEEFKGIQENIDLVVETGATVTVKFPDSYVEYGIKLQDGWLVIGTS